MKKLQEPAKSKRGREEGDGTENVINCRDVCRKSSWQLMTTYDDLWRFMSVEQRDRNCHKMSQVVVKCRKLSWRLSQIVVTFLSCPLPAIPFWLSPKESMPHPLPARLTLLPNQTLMEGQPERRPGLSSVATFRKCIQTNSLRLRLLGIHFWGLPCHWPHTWVGPMGVGMCRQLSCMLPRFGLRWASSNLRTSPNACETERDSTLRSLIRTHDNLEYRLLPCTGSTCMIYCLVLTWNPHVKTSGDELTQGVVITYVDDLLIAGWQHRIDAITQALPAKYAMKRSGSLQYDDSKRKSSSATEAPEGIDFLGARSTRDTEPCGATSPSMSSIVFENGFVGADGSVSLRKPTPFHLWTRS